MTERKVPKAGINRVPKGIRSPATPTQPKVNAEQHIDGNASEIVSSTGIKYCNRCEWNTDNGAADIPEGMTAVDMQSCPRCGQDLYEVDQEGNRISR